jgi:hypothetical protein
LFLSADSRPVVRGLLERDAMASASSQTLPGAQLFVFPFFGHHGELRDRVHIARRAHPGSGNPQF